jgi:multicomponent Na+:H+ antiporter subunit C
MEFLLALAFGAILSAGVYLLLARNLLRVVIGLILLSNAANLGIFLSGRLQGPMPPLVAAGESALAAGAANPLPQALILTAIVISFSLVAFTVVLIESAHRRLGTLDSDAMRAAEPRPTYGADTKHPAAAPTREAAE